MKRSRDTAGLNDSNATLNSRPAFTVREKVFACENHVLYKAEVIKRQLLGSSRHYFIHYDKWSVKYDAWVDENQLAGLEDAPRQENLIKYGSAEKPPEMKQAKSTFDEMIRRKIKSKGALNFQDKKQLAAEAAAAEAAAAAKGGELETEGDDFVTAAKNRKGKKNSSTVVGSKSAGACNSLIKDSCAKDKDEAAEAAEPATPQPVPVTVKDTKLALKDAAKRRWKETLDLLNQDLSSDEDLRWAVRIQVPMPLQKHLADEWAVVTKEPKKLLLLPRTVNFKQVLEDFLKLKCSGKITTEEQRTDLRKYRDMCASLVVYFNKALPTLLLYRQERKQYAGVQNMRPENAMLSDIYGAEHMLRFFGKF